MSKSTFFVILLFLFSSCVVAHSGRTNSSGCHNNKKTGGYHCHNSGSSSNSYSSPLPKHHSSISKPISSYSNDSYTSDVVVLAQKYLNTLGYDAGPEDGIIGTKTRRAIEKFQRKIGELETGLPTYDLLQKLRKEIDG